MAQKAPPHAPEEPSPEAKRLGYEPTGVSLKGLLWFVAAFLATAIFLHVVLWFIMTGAIAHEAKHDRANSVLADTAMPPPAAPPLQPSVYQPEGHRQVPAGDLQEMYYAEDELFKKVGWRPDPYSHTIQIPDEIVKKVVDEAKAREASAGDNASAASTRPTTGQGKQERQEKQEK